MGKALNSYDIVQCNMKVLQFKGADSINTYSENVYLLYVEEYAFNSLRDKSGSYSTEATQKYVANKQVLGFFNGIFVEL